tara:strand:+ start:370 stop:1248 length:879 start_codon:yes stop_codon:yes gene_type:complete
MTFLSIHRYNKLASQETKQLAIKELVWYNNRGLLFFLLSLVLIIESINGIIIADAHFYHYQPVFIPEAFIPDGGVSAIDFGGDGDSAGKVGDVGALFAWLYTTLSYGSIVSFYYENRSSRLIADVRNELMFGGSGSGSSSDLNSSAVIRTPAAIRTLLAKQRDEKPKPLDRPSTYNDIMAAMESNLQRALEVAELLQEELAQTKTRVFDLEVEVKKREEEITHIQQYKVDMINLIEEQGSKTDGAEKTLSLTDSVMVGDSIMGGVKIDKQINNDPEAIARAIIEAYRSGLND